MFITGTIQRLIIEKGFGFVVSADGGRYFFHRSAVRGAAFAALREGQAVTFLEGVVSPKGRRAQSVEPADRSAT